MLMSLIDIVQNTLSSMDDDAVNSIGDTPSSRQVAEVARESYYDMMNQRDWSHLREVRELEGLGDITRPNYLRIPEEVVRIDHIYYDTKLDDEEDQTLTEIQRCQPDDFLKMVYSRKSSEDNIFTVTTETDVPLFIYNDRMPTFWTSFDDEYIVFDAWDQMVDDTLVQEKSVVHAVKMPVFKIEDTFIPDLPEQLFPTYLADVKRRSHFYFKQQISNIDERTYARGLARQVHESWKQNGGQVRITYGRRGVNGYGLLRNANRF